MFVDHFQNIFSPYLVIKAMSFARNACYGCHDRLDKDFIKDEFLVVLSYIENSKCIWIDGQYCEKSIVSLCEISLEMKILI